MAIPERFVEHNLRLILISAKKVLPLKISIMFV